MRHRHRLPIGGRRNAVAVVAAIAVVVTVAAGSPGYPPGSDASPKEGTGEISQDEPVPNRQGGGRDRASHDPVAELDHPEPRSFRYEAAMLSDAVSHVEADTTTLVRNKSTTTRNGKTRKSALAPAADDSSARHHTCPKAPPYRASGTRYGVSLSTSGQTLAESVADVDDKFGRVPVVRMFHPSLPDADTWQRRAPALGRERTIVTSFKLAPRDVLSGRYDDRIRAYLNAAPANPILYSYFHEPDAKSAKGLFTPGEYRAAFQHVVEIAGSLCRDNLYPTLILTGWAADPASGRDWRDYYPGDSYVSVMSWDPYNSATRRPTEYTDPSTLYSYVVRESNVIGKPWGIAETGSSRIAGDSSGKQRAAWLTKIGAYFEHHGAAYVTYFQSTNDQDFELRDGPSISAWKAWVQS